MWLKQLDMQGYKSFASRTEFVFPTGITAIVGPNGSGKSNVADAIRWALGEQSVRMLRGKVTADMIFSGGQRRSRAGMAEVMVTLDNSDGWLPVDFAEVTIGRRAYRSGESEYLLNGNRVRLRDIADLLAESGLSQRTYTVIGQGLVDTALSLRPQERRALFEEAAGIAIYRSRREESADRLEETEHNLERVRDILGEITPRLKRLREQAERFREHEQISTHLKRLQRTWYGHHWGQAQDALRTAQARSRSLEESLSERQAEAESILAELVDLRQRQTTLRGSLRDAYRRTADLHDRADAAQRELATLTERVRLLGARREETVEELEPIQVQQQAQTDRVGEARTQLEGLQADVEERRARVAELEEMLQELRSEVDRRAGRRREIQQELQSLRAQREELDDAVAEARAVEASIKAEQELLSRVREQGAGTTDGTRALLQAGLTGVEGLLSRLIKAPKEWERAVEVALGPKIQTVVVRDWDVVVEAQRVVGGKQRLVLLPLAPLRAQSWEPPEGLLRAADVVTCESRLRPAIEALLGRTLLVPELEKAREAAEELPAGGRCVTRTGEIVAADGTVTLGSQGSVLAQERAWRELPKRLELAQRERKELKDKSTRVAQQLAALEQALEEADQQTAEAAQSLGRAESGLLLEARTELAVARQAMESQRTLLQREVATLERIKVQASSREERAAELAAEQASAQERLEGLREQTVGLERELAQVRARIGPAEDELSHLAEQQEAVEERERRIRQRVRQVEERVNRAHLEIARREDRLDRLQERIEEDLGLVELEVAEQVTAQTPLPLRPLVSRLPVVEVLPEGLEEEIQHLKSRLRQLGPVNPGAPQEYEELEERHHFLSEQVKDLEAASTRLNGVIDDLDRLMERAFRETFEAVAVAFEETFTRLFNGGSARLELTTPEDLAHTGVDIVARPPGKRTQSLALLSGGERALTAAALIFAILKVQPTPFCVLDEVDAMLDEANVARFRTMLEELSGKTQFIVITHNRGTVEAADTVYGISMGSEGASQAISLRLEGEEKER